MINVSGCKLPIEFLGAESLEIVQEKGPKVKNVVPGEAGPLFYDFHRSTEQRSFDCSSQTNRPGTYDKHPLSLAWLLVFVDRQGGALVQEFPDSLAAPVGEFLLQRGVEFVALTIVQAHLLAKMLETAYDFFQVGRIGEVSKEARRRIRALGGVRARH